MGELETKSVNFEREFDNRLGSRLGLGLGLGLALTLTRTLPYPYPYP